MEESPFERQRKSLGSHAAPAPWKIVQRPGTIVIVYEVFNLWRQVFPDGRELDPDVNPTWMAYSTGKWDGDTLVVDSRGFNGKAWISWASPRPARCMIERSHRKDFGHMNLQITIDDPKAYTSGGPPTKKCIYCRAPSCWSSFATRAIGTWRICLVSERLGAPGRGR